METQPDVIETNLNEDYVTPAEVEDTSQENEAPIPEEWTPDFNYKVMDEEREIPEWMRSSINNEEHLQETRRVFEQAGGLEHVERSRDDWKNKYTGQEETVTKYNNLNGNLSKLSNFVENKDFDSFFNTMKVPQELIYEWVQGKIDEQDLPDSVREQMQTTRETQARNFELERSHQQQQTVAQQQVQFDFDNEINSSIATVGDVAKQFNDRHGSADAFKKAMLNKGLELQNAGQEASPAEVARLVSEEARKVMGIADVQPGTLQQKASIPNMRAGAGSPMRKSPTSIADLLAISKAKFG